MARAAGRKPGRVRLDRMTVVVAARDLLDEGGVESFSMTRLGDRLGVTAMALYRHVDDREDLEQALVELVLAEFADHQQSSGDWEAAVAGWMEALRRCWVAHPWVGNLLGSATEISAAWLTVLDELANTLSNAGLPLAVVAREAEQISRTTIGILLQEVTAPLPYVGLNDAVITHLPEEAQPRWRSIETALRRYSNDDLFQDIIDATLLRLRNALRCI